MATKSINAKSQTLAARVPHEVVESMEEWKQEGESTGQFITAAIKTEIKRRQKGKKTDGERQE
jgi:hypothetical protein